MSENQGYYDTDISVELLSSNSPLADYFYLQDLKQRKLFLDGEINQDTISDTVHHILQYNREDADILPEDRQPILLYVNSVGGEVGAGFELIDVITASKTPVYTVTFGYLYSMGFLIGLAGHKRFGSMHSTYLLHDGSQFLYNSGGKVADTMEFTRKLESRMKDYILQNTLISVEDYEAHYRSEWYFFADEAKEKGIIDAIIDIDCDIDEVI